MIIRQLMLLAAMSLCQAELSTNSVHQRPADMFAYSGEQVQIDCSHTNSDFFMIQWYKQPLGTSEMTLIGFAQYNDLTVEAPFQQVYNVSGSGRSLSSLHFLTPAEAEDSVVYFCAASDAHCCRTRDLFSDQVHQTPAEAYKRPGETAELSCSHTIPSFNLISWYKQSERGQLQLLVYVVGDKSFPESNVSVKTNAGRGANVINTLTIEKLRLDNSAVYFCTSESNRTIQPPTSVKVLKPSKQECKNSKDKKNKKTLLCVASGFYPDHVRVFWQIDGEDIKDGVATDGAARREGEYYIITSRLRVSLTKWFTLGKNFTCTVSFFNGTVYVPYSNWVLGVEGPGAAAIRAKYLKTTQAAKLSYMVLIWKSSFYGLFVVVLLWRLQASPGKQNN